MEIKFLDLQKVNARYAEELLLLFIGGDYAWQAKAAILIILCTLTSIAAIAEGIGIEGPNGVKIMVLSLNDEQ